MHLIIRDLVSPKQSLRQGFSVGSLLGWWSLGDREGRNTNIKDHYQGCRQSGLDSSNLPESYTKTSQNCPLRVIAVRTMCSPAPVLYSLRVDSRGSESPHTSVLAVRLSGCLQDLRLEQRVGSCLSWTWSRTESKWQLWLKSEVGWENGMLWTCLRAHSAWQHWSVLIITVLIITERYTNQASRCWRQTVQVLPVVTWHFL